MNKVLLLIISLSLLFSQTQAQTIYDTKVKKLVSETIKLMGIMQVKTRVNVNMDDTLVFIIDSSFKDIQGRFKTKDEFGVKFYNCDLKSRSYIQPLIVLSPALYSIIFINLDTIKYIKLEAHSVIVHELTHYFDETWVDKDKTIKLDKGNVVQYISQPREFDAYAVGGYYLLRQHNKSFVKKTMNLKYTLECKKHLLINEYLRVILNKDTLNLFKCNF